MLPKTLSLPVVKSSNRTAIQIFNIFRYLLGRFLAVSITIVVGVFIMVVIANRGGILDATVQAGVDREIRTLVYKGILTGNTDGYRRGFEAAEGLSLSFWPKHLRYTIKALTMDWGDVLDRRKFLSWIESGAGVMDTADSREIILSRLPETLLLSGTAFLIVAMIGIPAALYLSQHEGERLDRIMGILSPLSSIPSWVIGVLLVLVFAFQLRLLPTGRMFDNIPPSTLWETITVIARHLVLPVMAIVLSIVFQLVYSWRTYLLIYSNEDYVILAKAKGLKQEVVNARYILRPALPFMITSLALTLLGFWQTTAALEFLFQWPGIGQLFVDALPHFRQETMYPGEMSLVLGIIVLFAYVLGGTIFLLDFIYLMADPRLWLTSQERRTHNLTEEGIGGRGFSIRNWLRPERTNSPAAKQGRGHKWKIPEARVLLKDFANSTKDAYRGVLSALRRALREIAEVPSAVIGLSLASLLVLASILITIFIPFDPIAKGWSSSGYTENPTVAKMALPFWVNWFRAGDLPMTIIVDGNSEEVIKEVSFEIPGMPEVSMVFPFDYPYQQFPSEIALYTSTTCKKKDPFLSVVWETPDGREISFKNISVSNNYSYPFDKTIPVNQQLSRNHAFKSWFKKSSGNTTPEYHLLFADPGANEAKVLPGQYKLRANGILFEEDCDLSAQLVVFGQVQGWAGTDYLRRDLLIPLLWGLPFALLIGVGGALITSVLSLVIAAASSWLGGWFDFLVQRATEANLILPVIGVGVLLFAYYQVPMLVVIAIIILSSVLGNATKVFRAAFLQEKKAGYVEAARTYGASDWRIISQYLVRRLMPVIFPQAVLLIPGFIFLEATLAIFHIVDSRYPTWGQLMYSGLRYGALFGSRFWILGPIGLMLLTSVTFVLISFALNRLLNPQLKAE